MARQKASTPRRDSMKPVFAALLGASLLFAASAASLAADRTVRFQNKEGVDVDDLHIETKQGVKIVEKAPFTGDRGVEGGNNHNLWGGTVAKEPPGGPPNEAVVKFESTSNEITIKQWWWTIGGNARENGRRQGTVKKDDGGVILSCAGSAAAGDGQILVSIDHLARVFQTQRGAPPDVTISMFHQFCESFFDVSHNMSLIHETRLDPWNLQALGNVLGNPETQLSVQMLRPDSLQQMTLLPPDTGIELAIDGACPGRVSAIVTGAQPGAPVMLAYALSDAQGTAVPNCMGVFFSLRTAVIVGQLPANGNGMAVFSGNVPRAGCGRLYLQAAEIGRCILSNTARL